MIFTLFSPLFLMIPPVKILIGALTIVLLIVLREIAFDPVWSLRAHIRTVKRLDAQEVHWREIRAGMAQACTEEEKEVKEMSEWAFEKKVFWMWNNYPKGYYIAQGKWARYLEGSRYTTVELDDDEEQNTETPSPNINLGVIYHRESES